ncbi:hypothetical protein EJ08DRAFT_651644 [Tothia fuscella]|uniref:SAP domain-containing protein n=1 Tax=Tothia fuscella TaxID=1048955 RepID=A0A9P4NM42_9PEZI|nr:hypothetical protein EJ08DRAFT_651644 [Tothia fuscella]
MDYDKLKVPELKKLLKDAGIAQTGLSRKAQYIEKLREYDENKGSSSAPAGEDQGTPGDANDTDATVTGDATHLSEETHPTPEKLAGSTTSSATLPVNETHTQDTEVQPTPMPVFKKSKFDIDEEPIPESVSAEPEVTEDAPPIEANAPAISDTPAVISAPAANDEPVATQPESRAESSSLTTPVPTQEIIEDNRKRKRRSMTPPVKEDEVAMKRQKQEESTDPDVSFTEATDPPVQEPPVAGTEEKEDEREELIPQEKPESERKASASTTKDVRYKSLFQTESAQPSQPPSAPAVHLSKNVEDAMHPVTRALYIRDFMRPLQTIQLRKHLASVAEPDYSGEDSDIIELLHLDQVRTHAFVLFTSAERAIAARSALHGQVWPDERTRKQLWADFIPEENVQRWIDIETDEGGSRNGMKRWEVEYFTNNDGNPETTLIELGAGQNHDRRPSRLVDTPAGQREIPTGPRSMQQDPRDRVPPPREDDRSNLPAVKGPNTDAAFEAIGTLFQTTEAKPKIYFKPVSEEIAEARKDEFSKQTSRDWKDKNWRDDDLYRFSFEDGSMLVHSGRHLMSGRVRAREEQITGVRSNAPAPPYRGGRGGYRGGHRGYRGGGNSYRP